MAGSADSAQYSALRQINRSNVHTLKVAWTYPTGDQAGYSFNPLVVDGVMYVLAKNNSIVALDATTGKEIWAAREPDAATGHHQPRHQLLGEQGPVGPPPALFAAITLCAPSMRGTGQADSVVRRRAAASI